MKRSPAWPLVLVLILNACRLWRDDDSRRSGKLDAPLPQKETAQEQAQEHEPAPVPPVTPPPVLFDYDAARDQVDLARLKAQLTLTSVTASMITEAFQKKAPTHPRIVADRADFQRIKDLLKAGDPYIVSSVAALKKSAQAYLNAAPLPYQLDDAKLRLTAPHSTQEAIAVLSFLYQLTGDRAYANKVKEHLLNYARFPDWNDARHFLDTGIMSYSVALGMDWTLDHLSPEERTLITAALVEKSLKPYLNRANPSAFWYQSRNNWNPICNGGVSLAALAIMDSSAANRQLATDVLVRALQAAPSYIREFEPDGQTVEGMMYWDYGMTNLIRWMETLRRSLGTDFGYTQTPGLKAAGSFPLAVSGPVTGISLGDDPLKTTRSSTHFWFAKRYNSPALARYHAAEIKAYNKVSWLDLLFYDPKLMVEGTSEPLPLDRYIRDLDYLSFRSSWNPSDAFYLGIHAGDNKASHGHLDAGTFFVQAAGQVWGIGGLGSDNYTFPGYFSKETLPAYGSATRSVSQPGRFHMYRLRAAGKNTLVFNPDAQPDQNPNGVASFERIVTRADAALALLNLTAVYDRDAKAVRRGVALREQRRVMIVQDEVQLKNPGTLWWSMHTAARIELQQSGRIALLKRGDQTLRMEIQSPAAAVFTVREASYLPGESFPLSQNSPNTFLGDVVRKLTIELKDVTAVTVTVGMSLGVPLPPPQRLDDWISGLSNP